MKINDIFFTPFPPAAAGHVVDRQWAVCGQRQHGQPDFQRGKRLLYRLEGEGDLLLAPLYTFWLFCQNVREG
ncbi:hypothetical protein R6Y99_09655 [Pseudomonas lundensis]|nr:hypothetical protein [Pseudomonas lundensis]